MAPAIPPCCPVSGTDAGKHVSKRCCGRSAVFDPWGGKKTIQQMLRLYVKANFKGFPAETLEDYSIFNQHMKLVLAQ